MCVLHGGLCNMGRTGRTTFSGEIQTFYIVAGMVPDVRTVRNDENFKKDVRCEKTCEMFSKCENFLCPLCEEITINEKTCDIFKNVA